MTDRLALPPRYRKQLEQLLREHLPEVEVWAYGSRVNGSGDESSELDLVLRGPRLERLGEGYLSLLEAIEESNIPILVQATIGRRCRGAFVGKSNGGTRFSRNPCPD